MVDTLASGASARKGVEVQVLSSAPFPVDAFPVKKTAPNTWHLRLLLSAMLCSPTLSWAAQEGVQANPKRWLLIFPVSVIILIVVLIKVTGQKK